MAYENPDNDEEFSEFLTGCVNGFIHYTTLNIAPRLNTLAVLSWTPSSRLVEQCRRHKLNTIVGIVVH